MTTRLPAEEDLAGHHVVVPRALEAGTRRRTSAMGMKNFT
jgi:hypothetical protein